MTFAVLHADNFTKTYRNFLYFYIPNEAMELLPETMGSYLVLNHVHEMMSAQYRIMAGWKPI